MVQDIFISMRPRQWLKNLFVFAALIFARRFTQPHQLLLSAAAFIIFCLLSGAVYLFNDLADAEGDRRHEVKKLRPIASGRLSKPAALSAALLVSLGALGAAFSVSLSFGAVSLVYLALMIAYSLSLKHVVIVDVILIAFGFILRVLAGGVIIQVPISVWLYLCTFLLSLFLALSKRRHEVVLLGKDAATHRKNLVEYSAPLLDQMIAVVTSSTLMAYALYTLTPRTRSEVSARLYLTIPFVVYGIFRYLYLVHRKTGGGEPGKTLLTDPALLADIVLWIIAVFLILRFFPPGG
jgi:4-hydroxybenzoate polyprenyltransferase